MTGVTVAGRKKFWPRYKYTKKKRAGTGRKGGRRFGRKVDTAITNAVHHGLPPSNREAKAVLHHIQLRGWTAWKTQVTVRGGPGLCTRLDILCHDEHGDHVLIEIKTGYVHYKHEASGHMNHPFQTLSDCPFHQHRVQVMLSAWLFEDTFATTRYTAELWYVDKKQVASYPVDCDVPDIKAAAYAALARETRPSKKKRAPKSR